MIIVPTEKQFDWKHAPVVLFLIVLLNVITYFFYQAGDPPKWMEAVGSYLENDYLELEWPLYKQYLTEQGRSSQLKDVNELYDYDKHEQLAVQMLLDTGFYKRLLSTAENQFDRDEYRDWRLARPPIQDKINSISSVAHGLRAADFKWSSLFTHQFLHGGVMHLLGNMFFLVICGFAVEAALGHLRFLLFYLVGGVAAGMAQVASDWQSTVPLVGASGAISAVMAMYLMVFRLQKIEFFYWVFFFVGYFRAPALVILPFYVGKEVYSFYASPESNVAFLAHAGGFLAGGLMVGLSMLIDKKTLNREYLDAKPDEVNPQRQQLSEIYRAIETFRFPEAYKLASESIKQNGETFELASIRFNLLNIAKGKGYHESIVRLWSLSKLLPQQIKKLDELWQDHPDLHPHISDASAITLGTQFAAIGSTQSAEQVFELLNKRGCTSKDYIVLCQRLANEFKNIGQPQKSKRCHDVAKQLIEEGHNGVL